MDKKERILNKAHKVYKKVERDVGHNVFPTLYRRPMFEFIYTHNKEKDLTGVEIGVSAGHNAKNILKRVPIKDLYLIDPYLGDHKKEFSKAKHRLHSFEDKTVFIKKKSEDAVDDIPDNLDFAYIDGNHEYEYVLRDIELYYPKIKNGGVIGGHDFVGGKPSVFHTVIEFVDKHNLELHTAQSDWWVIKK